MTSAFDATEETNWRDECKSLEVSFMQLKDEYSEIARALGFKGDGFWGDPLVGHSEVLARAKSLAGGPA